MATDVLKVESPVKDAPVENNEEVARVIANFDMDKTMTYFVGLMSMLGELSVKIGELEEKNSELPEIIKIISNNPKAFLNMLLVKSTGDEVRTLILALLKLDELSPKLANLFSLSADEKIRMGKELQSISNEIETSYKQSKKTREGK